MHFEVNPNVHRQYHYLHLIGSCHVRSSSRKKPSLFPGALQRQLHGLAPRWKNTARSRFFAPNAEILYFAITRETARKAIWSKCSSKGFAETRLASLPRAKTPTTWPRANARALSVRLALEGLQSLRAAKQSSSSATELVQSDSGCIMQVSRRAKKESLAAVQSAPDEQDNYIYNAQLII